jgi:arylsulfatase A-like enzyme
VLIAASLSCSMVLRSLTAQTPQRLALAYSCHVFALTSTVGVMEGAQAKEEIGLRRVPRAGERDLDPPPAGSPRPHVIVICLESTAYWSTSFGGQPKEQTPMLTRLAAGGVLFDNTRAVVTHTTQSQFSLLTGEFPNLDGGFVEAVLVDAPYESLVTILGKAGYRSRFNQMVRASFECNPGFMANLGFESFWSREDANDPSTHVGYFAGDDFVMIEPAFDWLDRQTDPCFMMFMTSVAHHPYEVPAWYGTNPEDPEEAFLQTVRYTDAFIKAVIGELDRRGIRENVLLCVLGDHGEGFGAHDILMHGSDPFDEALRIPWVLSWPGKVAGGTVVREPRCMLDVTPTILTLLGYDISRAGFEGRDALGPIAEDRKVLFSGWHPFDPAGYVQGRYKTVYWPSLRKVYRYDLRADPNEERPVVLDDEEAERMRKMLTTWRNDNRITFDAKRYRERLLFDCWQTSCLGNAAWCYYVPTKGADSQ